MNERRSRIGTRSGHPARAIGPLAWNRPKPAPLAFLLALALTLAAVVGPGTLPVSGAALSAPTWIKAVHEGYDYLTISWDATVSGASGYVLQRSIDGEDFETVRRASTSFASHVDAVSNGHSYRYRVYAWTGSTTGSAADTGTIPVMCATALTASATDSNEVVLNWKYPSGTDAPATGYSTRIERRVEDGVWAEITEIGTGTLSHVDTGLSEGITYEYRIRTDTGLSGTSLYYPKTGAVAATALLNKPTDFTATLDEQGKAILAWVDDSSYDNGVEISRSTDSADFLVVAQVAKNKLTWTDTTLENGHVYQYRIRFVSDDADSPWTDEETIVMAAPEELTIGQVYDTQVDLSWTYPDLDPMWLGEAVTVVERRLSGSSVWSVVAEVDSGVEEWRDQTVSADTAYYYRIRGRYEGGSYSPYVPGMTGTYVKTVIPLDVSFTGYALSSTSVRLEWDVSHLNGRKVRIERMDSSGDFSTVTTLTNVGTFVETGLSDGSEQTWRFRLIASTGTESVYSEELTLLLEPIPAPVTASAVNSGASRVSVSWTYPYDSESGFEIWRTTGSRWEKVGETARNILTWTDTAVPTSGTVSWKVRAVRGEDSWSAFLSTGSFLRDAPDVPETITATRSGIYLELAWSTALKSGAVYTIESRADQNDLWTDWSEISTGATSARVFLDRTDAFDVRLRSERDSVISWSGVARFWNEVPEDPSSLAVPIVGSGRAVLVWADGGEREDGFRIYRTVYGSTTRIGETAADAETWTDESPVAGASNTYQLEAWNGSGASKLLSLTVAVPRAASFTDLAGYAWASAAINALAEEGIVAGRSVGRFVPGASVTRAEYLKMLMCTLGILPKDVRAPFLLDGGDGLWYSGWVHTAVTMGFGLAGEADASRFRPNARITREEIALLTAAAAVSAGLSLEAAPLSAMDDWPDASEIPADAVGAFLTLSGNGVLTGDEDGRMNPAHAATRAEAATILHRLSLLE